MYRGYVCNQYYWYWYETDHVVEVVCRQLGYFSPSELISEVFYHKNLTVYELRNIDFFHKGNSYYGCGNGTIGMDRVFCLGTESALLDCSTGVPIGYANCGYDQMLSMSCQCERNSIIIVINFYQLKNSPISFPAIGGTNCTHGDVRLADRYYEYSHTGRIVRVGLKCVTMESGDQCAVMVGVVLNQLQSVNN